MGVLEGGSVGPLPCLVSGITMSSWTNALVRRLSIAVNTLQPITLLFANQYIRERHNILYRNKQCYSARCRYKKSHGGKEI